MSVLSLLLLLAKVRRRVEWGMRVRRRGRRVLLFIMVDIVMAIVMVMGNFLFCERRRAQQKSEHVLEKMEQNKENQNVPFIELFSVDLSAPMNGPVNEISIIVFTLFGFDIL